MNKPDNDILNDIMDAARSTRRQIKKIRDGMGSYDNPVDADLIKTIKANFYEKVIELLRARKG